MGDVADALINGNLCSWCGVYLEPNEKVFIIPSLAEDNIINNTENKMPKNGNGFGLPVVCSDCNKN